MKKFLRAALCAGLMTALLSIPALAAPAAPEMQGDFYVMVNGQYVTFTDAVPQIKDSRSCLPFVAVFEQLGFAQEDMTWDGETRTVTAAKGDLVISLTIGSGEITVTRGGVAESYTTDVAPYVSAEGRTYIPFGIVADILGYNVGWDAQTRAVIIDDVDGILAANAETYELMDQYLAYGKTFSTGNQKVAGGYAMNMDIGVQEDGQAMDMQFLVDGDYEMLIADGSAFQFLTDMGMDMAMSVNGEDASALLGDDILPEVISMELRGDMKDGSFYYSSAELAQMMGATGDIWFKLDLKALFDQMSEMTGMDYAQLMNLSTATLDQSFADSLAMILKEMPLTTVELTASDYLALFNLLCADSAFTKSGNDYVNNFVAEDGVSGTFTLTTAAGKVNGYSMDLTATEPTTGLEMTVSAGMKGKELLAEFGMAMDQVPLDESNSMTMGFTFSMGGTYSATNEKPELAPPAGAAILDLMEMMQAEAETESEVTTPAA